MSSLVTHLKYEELTPGQKSAYYSKIARDGRVTNMQATLLRSVPAFNAYIEWYNLRDILIPIFGERAIWIFCHSISEGTDCLICSTFFRRILIDAGISPADYQPNELDALLISLGNTFINQGHGIDPDVWQALQARYDDETLVALVAFGGLMVANNLFNNLLNVELDDYLEGYRRPQE
ncbi:hypothetical protein [Pectobacterium sp. B1J-3]|uniref:hypothetical protein n=1 Tax=Pectobacterium sp. B1J-3 TaxID=3385371 RepID=UPI0039057A1B